MQVKASVNGQDYCLDNNEYLFTAPEPLRAKPCVDTLKPAEYGARLATTTQVIGQGLLS